MLFSIIVPCFNCEDSIRRCLNSILSQSFSDFEIIAIDDGSTDGTSSILDEYDSKHEFIHTYHFSNSGVSISRKRGVTLASGKYIIFVDSDDSINPELLVNLYSTIIYQGDPDIIRYKVHLVDDEDYKDHERYNFSNSLEYSSFTIVCGYSPYSNSLVSNSSSSFFLFFDIVEEIEKAGRAPTSRNQ